jgi:hypothetical protein
LEEPDAADLASLALGPKAAATIREDAMTMRSIPDDDARAMRELIAELLGAKADLLVRLERTAAEIAGGMKDLQSVDRLLRRLEKRRADVLQGERGH